MRFDLELNIVNTLTQTGLDRAADLLYSDTSTEIKPMTWDTKALSVYRNSGNVDTSKFNNLINLDDNFIISGLAEDSTIELYDILDRYGRKYLLLNGGEVYSHRDKSSFSLNSIYGQINFSGEYYSYTLDSNFDINSIDIYTLTFLEPGYFKKNRVFTYVEYDGDSLDSTFDKEKSLQHKYTIIGNTVYLNMDKLEFVDKLVGKVISDNKIFAMPEFPVTNFSIRNMDSSDYKLYSGLIIFNKETSRPIETGEDIVVSFDVSPIISYSQIDRSTDRPDIILVPQSVDSKSLNFNNGAICLYQKYNTYSVPSKLETNILNTGTIRFSDSINVESKITGFSDIPIANKEIDINITSSNANWQSGGSTYSAISGIDGTIKASLIPNNSKIGVYIQREWIKNVTIDGVMRGQITLPYKHPSLNSLSTLNKDDVLNTIYLYTIQSDDPILGKMGAKNGEQGIKEYYSGNDISNYVITGRKIAYIKLVNSSGKIFSSYIKPINIEFANNLEIEYRDLFVYDDNGNTISKISNNYNDASLSSSYNISSLNNEYESGVLPFDTLNIYRRQFNDSTVITYDSPFPISDITINGMWLISDEFITITSSFNDNQVTLESESQTIRIKSIESEYPFMATGYSIDGYDTKINNYGYLTATEYIKNPFGLKSCSYYCIFSDAINKRCIHPDVGYKKYFELDSSSIGCIHTPEYDETIESSLRCPGVDAHIVNPFILTTN